MEAISKVTTQEPVAINTDFEPDEIRILDKKISRVMLELFEMLMPTLQNLNKASRQLGIYGYESLKKNSSSEIGEQRNIARVLFLGVTSAAPISKDIKDALSALTSSGKAYFDSNLSNASSNKSIDQDILSRANQDQSTLQNTIEKLLSLVQQVLQTERSSA